MDLLEIEVPGKLRVVLRGPTAHRHLGVAGLDAKGATHLHVSDPSAEVFFADIHGTKVKWHPGEGGPRLYEDTRYRLIAENLAATGTPQLVHRHPGLLSEVDRHDSQQLLTASLNFGRSIGVSTLSIRAGTTSIDIEIEVFPTKLDYQTDFAALLYDVNSAARGLALEYLRATFIRGGTEETPDSVGLEWLVLLRNQIDTIERSLLYVSQHPYRVLERHIGNVAVERIRRPDNTTRRAVARGLGSGEMRNVVGVGNVRPFLPSQQTRETLNTPEHRWLRNQLELVRSRLAAINVEIVKERRVAQAGHRSTTRIDAEEREISEFLTRLHRLSILPPFVEASDAPVLGAPSLTLLNGPGYRESYRALLTLRLGLSLDGEQIDFSLKELHVLYETWCFLRLSKLIAQLAGVQKVAGDVIETVGAGIRVRLRAGKRSEVTFDAGQRQFSLLYNPIYPGITGIQRPDIVLEFREHGWPRVIVVFDAKYRLHSDDAYIASFGSPGPPIDAVNALHRYRDAIVIGSGVEHGRPTVKGVALFPLPSDIHDQFSTSRLCRALDVLGVGALPFTPTNTDLVSNWLRDILGLPLSELASPGPPFLAWEHERGKRPTN